nr:alcohol dehydrogenase [Candidatus Pantoea persica]
MSENLSELYSNQRTLFGRGRITKLVPLLRAEPQTTRCLAGVLFLTARFMRA